MQEGPKNFFLTARLEGSQEVIPFPISLPALAPFPLLRHGRSCGCVCLFFLFAPNVHTAIKTASYFSHSCCTVGSLHGNKTRLRKRKRSQCVYRTLFAVCMCAYVREQSQQKQTRRKATKMMHQERCANASHLPMPLLQTPRMVCVCVCVFFLLVLLLILFSPFCPSRLGLFPHLLYTVSSFFFSLSLSLSLPFSFPLITMVIRKFGSHAKHFLPRVCSASLLATFPS